MNRGSGDPLPIIHLALGAGLLLFAAVLFVVGGPLRVEEGSVLRWVWLGVALLAVLATGAIRGRLAASEVEPARRRAGAITIWALAEGQALLGLVFYLLTGDVVPPAVGVLLFFFLWWRYRPTALPGAS